MNPVFLAIATAWLSGGTMSSSDLYSLRWQPKQGDVFQFESALASVEGDEVFEAIATLEVSVRLVGRDGGYQTESVSKGVLIRLAGSEMKDERAYSTLMSHEASGKILKILKSNDEFSALRSAAVTRFVAPQTPVSVGSSWQVSYAAQGSFNGARVNYKFEAIKGEGKAKLATVSFTVSEDNRERPFKGSGEWIIECETGLFREMSASLDHWLPNTQKATIKLQRLGIKG